MRATFRYVVLAAPLLVGLSPLAACGDSGSVVVFPSSGSASGAGGQASTGGGTSSQGGAGGVVVGGMGGAGQGGLGQGGPSSSTDATAASVSVTATGQASVASSTQASSSVAASSSSTGGGKTCTVAADCGSASCGWTCTAMGTCSLAAKPQFTACYQDGGTGASCDGQGSCKVWVALSTTNAPAARYNHSAVWTGTRMVVFGGYTSKGVTNTGYSYDPTTDAWTAISTTGAPEARYGHEAVWTGTKMVVWGGYGTAGYAVTGGIYDPATDSWTAMATTGQPPSRQAMAMVYTGTEMLVWGGRNAGGPVNSGGRYDVAKNSWKTMSTAAPCPSPRFNFSGVWDRPSPKNPSGIFFAWGGTNNLDWFKDGAIYDPGTDKWTAIDMTVGAPPKGGSPPGMLLEGATAFPQSPTQGNGLFLFGGWDGGNYGKSLYHWHNQLETDGYWYLLKEGDPAQPSPRARFGGAVLNAGIFLWGGCTGPGCGDLVGDGAVWRDNGKGGVWASFPEDAALPKRKAMTLVWTGIKSSEIIVFGGADAVDKPIAGGARRAVYPGM